MNWMISLTIAAMAIFAVVTAVREIILYGKSLRGDLQYLVSRRRRNRRLLISLLILVEAIFLFLGCFVLSFGKPVGALLYWLPPLVLVVVVIYLSLLDLRETSRDIDRILKEACESVLKKMER